MDILYENEQGWALNSDWEVYWRGTFWGKPETIFGQPVTEKILVDYIERITTRYPGNTPEILINAKRRIAEEAYKNERWVAVLSNGDEYEMETSNLHDAKMVLRHKLGRKRLPNGTKWFRESDVHNEEE